MAFLTRRSYFFFIFGSAFKGGASSDPKIDNVPKIHGGREYFNLELPKVEPFSMEFINDFGTLALKISHLSNPSLGSLSTQGWCKKPRITQ
jgi:hypothetical protein